MKINNRRNKEQEKTIIENTFLNIFSIGIISFSSSSSRCMKKYDSIRKVFIRIQDSVSVSFVLNNTVTELKHYTESLKKKHI